VLSPEETAAKEAAGITPTIRIRIPKDEEFK
jgi:hypothetical protein